MPDTAPPTPEGTPPSAEILKAVVDRLVSWQATAEDATVEKELDKALNEAGLTLKDPARQTIITAIESGDRPDLNEVSQLL